MTPFLAGEIEKIIIFSQLGLTKQRFKSREDFFIQIIDNIKKEWSKDPELRQLMDKFLQ